MSRFRDYAGYDGLGLAALVKKGEVSAAEVLEAAIERAEQVNGALNAIIIEHYDLARAAVAAGLPEGPFSGVPFLLKNLDLRLAGTRTTFGSAMYADYVSDHDSTLVARFREAGLVTFGKTNSPEFGLLPVTEPALHGPSRNPWHTAHTTGGSSGGAGAAVAAGIVPIAHASDGGGSIRIPASCCGLVGLKPTRGRTPCGPDDLEGWAGQVANHVVTRTVRDSAAALDAIAGPEPGAPYHAPPCHGTFLEQVGRPAGKLRIAVATEKWSAGKYQPEVLEGLENTAALLTDLGHSVEAARPDVDFAASASAMAVVVASCSRMLCQLRAEELGRPLEQLPMEDGTRLLVELGAGVTGADYARAIRSNQQAGLAMARFHDQYDVVLTPTMSREPVPIGYFSEAPADELPERLDNFMGETILFNQTGQPSISLPLHWSASGLPVGMMFSAAFGDEALLLRLAAQLEAALPWRDRHPPLWQA